MTRSANMLVSSIKIFLKKKKKRQYGCEQEKNLLEDEYRKHSSRTQEIAESIKDKQSIRYFLISLL